MNLQITNPKTQITKDNFESDSKNVTPKIVVIEPVVNQGIKGIWDLLRQFVSVGGDFA